VRVHGPVGAGLCNILDANFREYTYV